MKPRLLSAFRSARRRSVSLPLAAVSALAVGGCSLLPQAQLDPTRFYLLSSSGAPAAAPAGAPAVMLRPVEVASYLRNRSIIVRRGGNEIEFRDLARWGEPLEQGVGRVLREELLARGLIATPTSPARSGLAGADTQLAVRVLACEGAADGTVLFSANWEWSRIGAAPAVISAGEFRASGLRWDGKSEASLAAQLSTAVSGLAADLAGALAKR